MSPSPHEESPPSNSHSSKSSSSLLSSDSSESSPPSDASSSSPSDHSSSSSSPPNNANSPPSSDAKSPPSSDQSSSSSKSPPPSDKSSHPPPSDHNPPPSDHNPPPSDHNSPPSGNDNSSHSNNNNSPPHDGNNSGGDSNKNNNNNNSANVSGKNENNSSGNNNNNNNNNNNSNKYQPPPRTGSSNGNSAVLSPPHSPPSQQARSASLPSLGNNLPPSSDSPPTASNHTIIIGAAAGAGLLVVVMIVCIVSCARRKKKRPHNQMQYYKDNSHGGGYFNSENPRGNANNNLPPLTDHMVNVPPRISSAQVSSEYNWPIAPPPPPPMMSSELSSAGFSGPYQAAQPPPHPVMALGFNQSSFTYNDLAVATNNFAQSNLLGQGGFGYVHKGVLPNGKEIAVKSLKASSGQGEREFQAEVDIISRVHHRHLVSLVGYCIAGAQRMLVYEFVPNGTLEYHLHGDGRPTMNWATRLKIALGSAKGFAYLHEDCHPRIIHRDIKTANILLEHNFEAKVADFGLAKLSSENHTHVSTRIMGTFGYLAPEYASSGKLTEKSDVYSYGIMLMELISGRRPIDMKSDDDNLVDWARPILLRVTEGESYEELVDPRLENNFDPQEMFRMVSSAAACVRQSAKKRPKMSQIVRILEGDVSLDVLNEGVRSVHSAMFGSGSSEDDASSVDMNKFRKGGATSSQEYSSSELGTGEFVNNNNKH